jgi:hypothetical protein
LVSDTKKRPASRYAKVHVKRYKSAGDDLHNLLPKADMDELIETLPHFVDEKNGSIHTRKTKAGRRAAKLWWAFVKGLPQMDKIRERDWDEETIVSLYVMCAKEIRHREKEDEQNEEERDHVDDAGSDGQDEEVTLVESEVLSDEDEDDGF